jgi:hypothetical protein
MNCLARSISLNKISKYFDGQWQGIKVASDNSCYFGSSTHSPKHGSSFLRFNPKSEELTVLAEDMTEVCGENLSKTPPQGKIHSPIVEYDGWLYFTTHLSNYWEEAIRNYTGAHVIGYELSSGKFRDFGVVRKGFSIYSGINVDPINNKLYVFSVPFAKNDMENDTSHLYQIDIVSGEMFDIGPIPKTDRGPCFWFYIDIKGNCWFTVWKKFNPALQTLKEDLYCFNYDLKKIQTYENVLPPGRLAPNGDPAAKDLRKEASWTWAEGINNNRECLFVTGPFGGGDERLWIFDPSKNIENGDAFKPIAYIGATFLSIACNDKRAYFVQYKELADSRNYCTEFIRDTEPKDIHFNDDLHLRSVSINPAKATVVVDHGKIVDQDDRRITMVMSIAADNNGRVYMNGSWGSLSKEESSHQYIWQGLKDDYENICGIYKDAVVGTHKLMHRGQFFSYIDTYLAM